jgi:hypothetical protein
MERIVRGTAVRITRLDEDGNPVGEGPVVGPEDLLGARVSVSFDVETEGFSDGLRMIDVLTGRILRTPEPERVERVKEDGAVLEFEPGFGSEIGAWNTAEWEAYRERIERAMDDPAVVGAAGGEIRVPWRRDNGDWDRVEAAGLELLEPVIRAYGPARFGGSIARTEERDIRLLRALSIVGGWDLVATWQQLLSALELELGRAKGADLETEEKTGVRGRRLGAVRDAGITADAVWAERLDVWWPASGRAGKWERLMHGVSALAWTEIPEEATVGPCIVRWLDPQTYGWNFTAMVNGELRDADARVYSGLTYFFHVLTVG